MTIACLGEALVDLVCERELSEPGEADHFVPHPGGALANVAVAARRAGAEVVLVGGVGADDWGEWLRERLWREGVDTRWLAAVDGVATPVAFVTFDWDREPSFAVYGEAIGATMRAAGTRLEQALASVTALVFGSNTLVGEPEREVTLRARRSALDRSLPVLFDPNFRPNRWRDLGRAAEICRDLIDGAFVVHANREEAELLTGAEEPGAAASELCALGARLAVVTLGAQGALIRGEAEGEVSSPDVEVVSPLGAGDAFMGALAAGLAAVDWDPTRAAEALPAATAAGARACTGWGAQA
jgi:sugar/nucleoside kinase (ribokinase family)